MAFVCEHCGYRNSEIKEGGGIGDKAKKITYTISESADLNRDVFKSDSAAFSIPELGFEMEPGSLGSLYTTAEGLLTKVIERLEENNPFGRGDSKNDSKMLEFLGRMKDASEGKVLPITIILDDPADNCFIYNPNAPNDDPKIKVEYYERTEEQKDYLGISQMNVDNYTDEK